MRPDEREAFSAFVAARHTHLLRTAYLLVGDRIVAEDLLQTALAKTYLAWSRIDPVAADAYVRRVMVNTRTSWWRRRKVDEYAVPDVAAVAERGTGRDATADVDLHDALWQALAGLPRRARAMVVLRYYEDLSEAEVADLLGVSTGTVKSTVSRALVRLRESRHLADHTIDPEGRDDLRLALPHAPGGAS